MEIGQAHPTRDDIAHVHIAGAEPGTIECRRHFDLAVDALLAQDRNSRATATAEGCTDIVIRIKAEP